MKNIILTIVICLSGLSIKTSSAQESRNNSESNDSLNKTYFRQIAYEKQLVDVTNLASNNKEQTKKLKAKRPIGLKTNLFYWLAATPNLSVEVYLSKRLSLSTEVDFAWWSNSASQFYWQILSVSPELRYQFGGKAHLSGHYVGLYLGGGIYDIMVQPLTGNKGYRGDYYLSAGLTYGYQMPIGKHLALEMGIGIGYMVTNYKEYTWSCSKYMHTQTKRTTWIGPTKINLTLVWQILR